MDVGFRMLDQDVVADVSVEDGRLYLGDWLSPPVSVSVADLTRVLGFRGLTTEDLTLAASALRALGGPLAIELAERLEILL